MAVSKSRKHKPFLVDFTLLIFCNFSSACSGYSGALPHVCIPQSFVACRDMSWKTRSNLLVCHGSLRKSYFPRAFSYRDKTCIIRCVSSVIDLSTTSKAMCRENPCNDPCREKIAAFHAWLLSRGVKGIESIVEIRFTKGRGYGVFCKREVHAGEVG